MSDGVYILGGFQTDFARNWSKENRGLFDILQATVLGGLEATKLDAAEIESAHVGNFTGELFCRQGHLGGFFASLGPAFSGLPTARHEAACASGGVATLAASAEIEAGRYGLTCVVGLEQERNVPGKEAADFLGVAAWTGREAQEAKYPWPHLFSCLGDEYQRRYGLDLDHLQAISRKNFSNAKKNPNAQTRAWHEFDEDPVIEGNVRRTDCSQITDGGAVIFLASAEVARSYATKRGIPLERIPRILGWGHRTATMLFSDKLEASREEAVIFPHVRGTILDALGRAECDVHGLDGIETHDCFTITEYMAIDHFGLTAPGASWKAIEEGRTEMGGDTPINPSGGLIGGGHPVGATGVRQVLDAYRQVTGSAGDYQVEGAKRFGTLNIGGTATTSVSFVVGVG